MKVWSWLRCGPQQGQAKFEVEYGHVQYENKVEITKKIHSLNFLGENNPKGVQKLSWKDHLLINTTCIGKLT